MPEKIRKNIRLTPQLNQALQRYAADTGESETLIIAQALERFFSGQGQENEEIADLFLQKFDEKYSNYMTRVRLASRGADENTQVLLEIVNTVLFLQGIKGDKFLPMDKTEHSLLKRAKEAVKERIARFKQRKDMEAF